MSFKPDRNTCKFCPDEFEQEGSDATLTNNALGASTLTKEDPFPSLKTPVRATYNHASSSKGKDITREDVVNQVVSSGSLTVLAQPGLGISDGRVTGPRELMLTDIHRVDYGTFGTIYRAYLHGGKKVAIKKVLQHSNYRNRELTILKDLNHPNIVTLYYYFYTKGDEPGSDYLHLVMEFFPSNLARLVRHHRDKRTPIPMVQVKCLMYQMFRGLNYLHYQDIGHRDIKPHNLLLDPQTSVLKVCDFGCAKKLMHGETSISYICSRYYRPPELCMGATQYGVGIDMWSGGCVVAEMFLSEPIFRGSSREDQMIEIIKILGTPSKDQLREMKVYEAPFRLPKLDRTTWPKRCSAAPRRRLPAKAWSSSTRSYATPLATG